MIAKLFPTLLNFIKTLLDGFKTYVLIVKKNHFNPAISVILLCYW